MEPTVRERWRTLRALAALIQVSFASVLQYRSDFIFTFVTVVLGDSLRVAPLILVFWHREEVAGWDLPHALLVMAFFFVLFAVQAAVFEPNLGEAIESIRTGSLDLLLLKPVDAQLLVSLRRIDAASVWPLVSGLLLGIGALSISGPPRAFDVLLACVLFVNGLVAIYGLWLLAICVSFWFVRVDNLRFLLWAITDAGRWPIDVFRGPVRWVLTAVVPVALITSFPAQALQGAWTGGTLITSSLVAVGFVVGSRIAWTRSLAAYTSASS